MSNKYTEIKFVSKFFDLIDENPNMVNTVTTYVPKEKLNFEGPYVLIKYENGLNIIVNSYDYDELLHNIRHPITVLNTTDNFYLFKED